MAWILRYRNAFLILIIAGTLFFLVGLSQAFINFSFDSFFPKENPEYQFFLKFKEEFAEKQDFMVSVAIKSPKKDVFDVDFLQDVDSLFARIGRIKGIDTVMSGTRAMDIRRGGMGIKSSPYFQFETEEEVQAGREKLKKDSSIIGIFITPDRQYICGHILLEAQIADIPARDVAINKMDSIVKAYKYEHFITGVPYIRTQYVSKIQMEVVMFVAIATFLLVTMLWFTFRNKYSVFLPLLTIVVGCIWTFGLMGWFGQPINLVTNLLIPIIFVVGTSDIIHITTKYLAELKAGHAAQEAMLITLKEIGFATFLTCITTAVGFASLAITDVEPIRVFGLYGCFGVVSTYFISISFIPNVLLLIPSEKLTTAKSLENSPKWDNFLLKILHLSLDKPLRVSLIFVVVIVLSTFYTFRIPMDMHILEELSERDPTRTAMIFFEKEVFGVRPFELVFTAKGDKDMTNREVLLEIEKVQNELAKNPNFKLFISPISFLKTANYISHFKNPAYNKIPDTQAEIDELFTFAETKDENNLLKNVISTDKKSCRLGARTSDLGSDTHKKIREDLMLFIRKNTKLSYFDYQFTGHGYMTEGNLSYLRNSLLQGLLVDFLTIGLLMGLMFGSFRMLFLSMVPNLIPLLITAGVMGLLGVTLTASGAVVFVVIFGIAVDDTIHFLTHYRLELRNGHKPELAIKNTMLGTGKAMILTSVVLLSGFVTLLSSSFGSTFTIGLFSLITIVFAVISDLFLGPILIQYFGPKK